VRVGLVCPYSLAAHGGVQNHVLGLADALRERGHEARVLAPGDPGEETPTHVTTIGRAIPVPYNGSVARVSFGPLVARRVRRWLESGRFDVVHIHEPATPSVSVLALWATTSPVVATYHTAQERPRALELSAATFLRPGLAKVLAHVAVSEAAGRTMARYLDVTPVVIPNGVDTALYRAGPPASRSGAGPTLAFVGRVDEPRKGFDVLLRALPAIVDRHPAARLEVVGEASAAALAGVPGPLRRRVRLLGPVTDVEKAALLARADLVVAPNTHGESFGIVLVEAMAAGSPLVASDLPAFRDLLRDGEVGALFRTGDADDLARQALRLLADPVARLGLADAARRTSACYDWAAVAPRLLGVYDAVRQPPRRAAG
jgi:phosphatidylinositol alpha-mannosyltransferase